MGNHNSLRLGRGWVARLRGGMLASLALLVSCTPNLGEKPGGLIPLAMSMFDSPENLYENLPELVPAPASAGSASTPDDRRTKESATPARPGATPTPRHHEKPTSHAPTPSQAAAPSEAAPAGQVDQRNPESQPSPTEGAKDSGEAWVIAEPTASTVEVTPTPQEAIVETVADEGGLMTAFILFSFLVAVAAFIIAVIALGAKSTPGPRGETGPRGLPGPMGPPGISGESGDTGSSGERGPRGHIGESGERGLRGHTGKTGATGEEGEEGVGGEQGERGLRGRHGEAGEQGPRGPKGR